MAAHTTLSAAAMPSSRQVDPNSLVDDERRVWNDWPLTVHELVGSDKDTELLPVFAPLHHRSIRVRHHYSPIPPRPEHAVFHSPKSARDAVKVFVEGAEYLDGSALTCTHLEVLLMHLFFKFVDTLIRAGRIKISAMTPPTSKISARTSAATTKPSLAPSRNATVPSHMASTASSLAVQPLGQSSSFHANVSFTSVIGNRGYQEPAQTAQLATTPALPVSAPWTAGTVEHSDFQHLQSLDADNEGFTPGRVQRLNARGNPSSTRSYRVSARQS